MSEPVLIPELKPFELGIITNTCAEAGTLDFQSSYSFRLGEPGLTVTVSADLQPNLNTLGERIGARLTEMSRIVSDIFRRADVADLLEVEPEVRGVWPLEFFLSCELEGVLAQVAVAIDGQKEDPWHWERFISLFSEIEGGKRKSE